MKRIIGTNVNLRQLRKTDADTIYRLCRDREIGRNTLIPFPYKREHASGLIRRMQAEQRRKAPRDIVLAMEDKQSGGVIGLIGLHGISYHHRKAEIGCWVGRQHRGRGIGTEAIRLMLRLAFVTLRLRRVQASVFPANEASQKMVENAGFTREGFLREAVKHHGRYRDEYVYSILRSEYHPRHSSR